MRFISPVNFRKNLPRFFPVSRLVVYASVQRLSYVNNPRIYYLRMQAVKGVCSMTFMSHVNVHFDYKFFREFGYDHWDALYMALMRA